MINLCLVILALCTFKAYSITPKNNTSKYVIFSELGFEGVTGNSLDATSDRDFVCKSNLILKNFIP